MPSPQLRLAGAPEQRRTLYNPGHSDVGRYRRVVDVKQVLHPGDHALMTPVADALERRSDELTERQMEELASIRSYLRLPREALARSSRRNVFRVVAMLRGHSGLPSDVVEDERESGTPARPAGSPGRGRGRGLSTGDGRPAGGGHRVLRRGGRAVGGHAPDGAATLGTDRRTLHRTDRGSTADRRGGRPSRGAAAPHVPCAGSFRCARRGGAGSGRSGPTVSSRTATTGCYAPPCRPRPPPCGWWRPPCNHGRGRSRSPGRSTATSRASCPFAPRCPSWRAWRQ